MKRTLAVGIGAFLSVAMAAPMVAEACTRAVYFGLEGQTVTGRTMDWFVSDMDTNLWMYPRGLERNSNTATPLIWKSKYGSVVTTVYEGVSADGMNEKGLVANMLYLAESEYPPEVAGDTRPTLPITAWVQYVLDNYATTAEAVEALRKEDFRMVTVAAPTGEPGTVHLSISDASGDSAIFQYIGGKLVIHHSREYQVMTNSPTFDKQLALNGYWKTIGGSVMLPGTNRASDRFVAHVLLHQRGHADRRPAPRRGDGVQRDAQRERSHRDQGSGPAEHCRHAVADGQRPEEQGLLLSGHQQPEHPMDKLGELDFSEGSGPRKLQLDGNPDFAGDQTKNFQPAELFKFMAPHGSAVELMFDIARPALDRTQYPWPDG